MQEPLKVLLIEDSADDAVLLGIELKQCGYDLNMTRVQTKAETEQALNQDQTWDVIIADYNLPGFDAIQALKIMKELNLDIPFIIISGTIGEAAAVSAMKAGAQDFILKGHYYRLCPAIERECKDARIRKEKKALDAQQAHIQAQALEAVLIGQDQERQRIARELHDGLSQLLFAARMNFSQIQSLVENGKIPKTEDFQKVQYILDETIQEIRSISHNLMPRMLEEYGLELALKSLCQQFMDTHAIRMQLHIYNYKPSRPMIEMYLYRIVQEAITNIIKHAQASLVSIQLSEHDNQYILTIEDNGTGFDPQNAMSKGGIGLKNLAARVQTLKGKVEIDSALGRGTLILVEIPIPADYSTEKV